MSTANATELRTFDGFLRARANRAIASSLLNTQALLTARRGTLSLLEETLRIHAAYLRHNDPEGLQRLCVRIADYYRAHGRLRRIVERFGRRIDQRLYRLYTFKAGVPSTHDRT